MKLCDRCGTGLVFRSQGKKSKRNHPDEVTKARSIRPFGLEESVSCSMCAAPSWGTWFQLHLGYISEEPSSSRVCGCGTVPWSEKLQGGWPLGLSLQRDLCLISIPTFV